MSEFLLEIGTEEIPDRMVEGALADLEKKFLDALESANLRAGVAVKTEGTPRRLALIATGLEARQADREETLSGPPKNVAFDDAGNPTKAGLGFARRAGAALEDIEVGPDNKLRVVKKVAGRATRDLLAEALPEVIVSVYFPKTMYWAGKTGPRFIRPIRWLLALFDGSVVEFEIAGVASSNRTQGHRRLGKSDVEISDAADYRAKLAENCVVLAAIERRGRIGEGIRALVPPDGPSSVVANPQLLNTLTYLTEYPTVISGEFDPTFLSLPKEVLETVMLVHQKYFAVANAESGEIEPRFLAVTNLNGDPDGIVRRGNERVLRARFNDARFFWETDQQRTLADRVEDLKAVTFLAKLGSYFDKSERMRAVVAKLADSLGVSKETKKNADRAAQLAKCDLTTEMVGEFPELQGAVGGLYAAHQGEPQAVADAIYDHYKPVGAGDEIPRDEIGRLVAITDKLDTLGGMFRLGKFPTGSRDPFALRRAAYGVILIIVGGGMRLSLSKLCEVADAGGNQSALREFFVDRLRYYLGEEKQFKYDEINAVLSASDDDPLDAAARAEAIAEVRPTADFEPLAVSFKRIENILKKAGGVEAQLGRPLDESLLEAGAERELFDAHQSLRQEVERLREAGAYREAFEKIAALRPAVDAFFDKVLVMAKDDKVRDNRLTFLARLLSELSTIANFADIVSE